MAEPAVLAAAVAKKAAKGGQGEEIEIPYLGGAEKKKVRVTVEVRRNRDDEDFEEVGEAETWKMGNPWQPVPRRSYFVKKNAHVTVRMTNLENRALTLQVTHVDESFKHAKMEEVLVASRGVYEYKLDRSEGEDRESLQVCDSAGGLSLMLSVQEELAAMEKKRKKRARGEGSVESPIRFEDADLDQALRRLRLLGVGAGGAS
jgi:hypothetical protein